MSRRFHIVLPDPVAERLAELAAQADQPPSRIAAQLVSSAIARGVRSKASVLPREPLLRRATRSGERPEWLEPYGGNARWRARMWAAICVLRERYPRELSVLQEGWWKHEAQVDALSAFASWREHLDEAGSDPREEILFQATLRDYAAALRAHGGGVSGAWEPGAPPPGWGSADR